MDTSRGRHRSGRIGDSTERRNPVDQAAWDVNGIRFATELFTACENQRLRHEVLRGDTQGTRTQTGWDRADDALRRMAEGSRYVRNALMRAKSGTYTYTPDPDGKREWNGLRFAEVLNEAASRDLQDQLSTATALSAVYERRTKRDEKHEHRSKWEEQTEKLEKISRDLDGTEYVRSWIESCCSARGWSRADLVSHEQPPSVSKQR